MSLVSVDRLRYSYPRSTRAALDNVSLAACAGEVVLLAGPSGSGKSTLLRSLTGLAPQFYGGRIAGSVRVSGMDPTSTPARRMAEVAGLLFQEPETQTIGDSVEEDVAFGLEQRNEPQRVMAAKVGRCLELAGVAHLAARRVSTLSGGERQRVAIAAMLALEPRLLLLDEPSSQLDPDGEALLVGNLLDLRDRTGITLLVSEHRLHRWLPAADRVLAIESGRVRRLSSQGAALLPGAPPVCELGRRLGLDPPPLTPAEARTSLSSRDGSPRVQAGP
ncbi:MAG: ABC transporter ATP-binding protein, partial [Dehalococcoidia bacterium]